MRYSHSKSLREMLRVTKTGGFIRLPDWRFSKPWSSEYRGVTKSRVRNLLRVGGETDVVPSWDGCCPHMHQRYISWLRLVFLCRDDNSRWCCKNAASLSRLTLAKCGASNCCAVTFPGARGYKHILHTSRGQ